MPPCTGSPERVRFHLVQVRADGDAAPLVGGVDESVETLGRIEAHRQQANVIEDDQLRSQDPPDGPRYGVVGPVAPHENAEILEDEPGDLDADLDGGLANGFEEERLPRARRSAYHDVLAAPYPLQGAQGGLGRCRDGGRLLIPGLEGLAGRKAGCLPSDGERRPLPPGELLSEQAAEHFGRLPALGLGGRQRRGCAPSDVRQAETAQQGLEVVGEQRRSVASVSRE